jgi:hypothetical protein
MATKEEQDALLKKSVLTAEETQILQDDADALKSKHDTDVKRLAQLRKKDGLSQAEHDEVDFLRHKIGPEIKQAANMDRKTGRPVESVR